MTVPTIHRVLLAAACLLCFALPARAGSVVNLTPAQAQDALQTTPDVIVMDIRTPDEFRSGHLRGAVNIDFYGKDFQAHIDALDKEATYFIYCRTGRRSGVTVRHMAQTGFKHILHLEKGISSWIGAGLPTTR